MDQKNIDHFVKKLLNNMGWQSFGMMLRAVTAFVALGIIASIAGAEIVGIYGISWVFIFGAYTIIQGICGQSLIGLKNMEGGHVNACFFLSLLLPLVILILFFLLLFFTNLIGHDLKIILGIKLGLLILPLMSIAIVENALLQKEMNFKLFSLINTVSNVLSALIAVFLAVYVDPLIGLYCLTGTVGLFQFIIYRLSRKALPIGKFTSKQLMDVWNTGKHFALNAFSGAVWVNSPQLILATFFSLEQVGIYVLCRRLIEMVATQVSGLVNAVIFPSFSSIRNDLKLVRDLFLRCNYYSATLMMFPLLVIGSNPGDLLEIYAGAEWRQGSIVLLLIVLMQIGLNFGQAVFPTFQSLGEFSIAWKWNIMLTVIQCTLLFLFGTVNVERSAGILVMSTFIMPLTVFLISQKLKFEFMSWIKNMMMVSGLGILMLIASQFVLVHLADTGIFYRILFMAIGSCVTFAVVFYGLRMHLRYQ